MTPPTIFMREFIGEHALPARPLREVLPCDIGGGALAFMLSLPETVGLALGPLGCLRRFYFTARKYGFRDPMFTLRLSELEVVLNHCIDRFGEAVRKIIQERRPKLVACLSTCLADLLHTDYEQAALELEEETGVLVRMVRMNPISKKGANPSRRIMFEAIGRLLDGPGRQHAAVNIIGPVRAMNPENEIFEILKRSGIETVHQLAGHSTWESFQSLAGSSHNLAITPAARHLTRMMRRNQNIPYIFIPPSYDPETIALDYEAIGKFLGCELIVHHYYDRAASLIASARARLKGMKIAIGSDIDGRPLDMALTLVKAGFLVTNVFVDELADYDEPALDWLRQNAPDVLVHPALHPSLAQHLEFWDDIDLAVGLDAGFYCRRAQTAALPSHRAGFGFFNTRRLFSGLIAALDKPADYQQVVNEVNGFMTMRSVCL